MILYMSSSGWLHMDFCYSQCALDMTGLGEVCIYGLNYVAQWSGSTCKLGPQAISFLCEGSCSAALLLRIGPGALQVLLQRGSPLALRLRGVPCAVQLLLQALRPLPSCNNINGASATRSKFPEVM